MECQSQRNGEQTNRVAPPRPPPPVAGALGEETNTYANLQRYFNKAHHCVEKALSCDEEGKVEDAKGFYERGLRHIVRAMAMDCEDLQGATADQKDSAKQMHQKLTKTKLQIEYRLQAIQSQATATSYPDLNELMDQDAPPSYDEAMSSGVRSPTLSPGDTAMVSLGDSIMNEESHGDSSLVADATRVFEIPDGVQIFFITPEGYVSAPSYPSSLRVFKFMDFPVEMEVAGNQPPAFMQVNDWVYPLIPGTSPALHTSYGAYLFPDTASQNPGAAVGLMLPENLHPDVRQNFEHLLRSLTVMQEQQTAVQPADLAIPRPVEPVAPPAEGMTRPREDERGAVYVGEDESTSGKISKGLIVAADWISWGIGKGAEKAGQFIRYGSEKMQTRLQPNDKPKHIEPAVQKGATYARQATHVAVKVSSFVVNKLGDATAALGRQLAPHIRKHGEKLLPKSMKENSDGKSKWDGVIEVAASGLKGFGTVYMSLETSAKALAKNLANETVHIVNHKYGAEAGHLTENTLFAAGNVAMTAYNADNLGVKAIAKRAAKDTGKAVLSDLHEKRQQEKAKAEAYQNGAGQCNGEKLPSPKQEKPPQ